MRKRKEGCGIVVKDREGMGLKVMDWMKELKLRWKGIRRIEGKYRSNLVVYGSKIME